jgi:dolichyl-phosphate-mannose--protein O-mannosyl transferase
MSILAVLSARLRLLAREVRGAWSRLATTDKTLAALLVIMILVGVLLRVQDLGYPPEMSFDERHFVENARNYLAGRPDRNDHPPYGKLLIALGFLGFGDTSTGWRVIPLVFGLQTLVLSYWLAKELFRDRWAGLAAAAFLAADGFPLTYSRTALVDGLLLCFALWAVLGIVHIKCWYDVILVSILIGLTASIKMSGIVLLLPLAVVVLGFRTVPWWSIGLALIAPLVFALVWTCGLALSVKPFGPADVVDAVLDQLRHHAKLTEWRNPLVSKWYTWPVLHHPIVMRRNLHGDRVRLMCSVGNPVLWLSVSGSVIITSLTLAFRAAKACIERAWPPRAEVPLMALTVPLVCWMAFIAPWIVSNRDSYYYHYLVPYCFGLLLVGGLVSRLRRANPWCAVAIALLVLAALTFYAPVWAQLPISQEAVHWRLPFRLWR